MPEIHPTAIVEAGAELADDVVVGPYCMVGPHARIGSGTRLDSHVVLTNRTLLGEHNRVRHHAVLGGDPQDLKFRDEPATLEIGDHNDIREFATMHIGTANGGSRTTVGSHNLFMVGAHVAHDSHIGNHCILANNVLLAGHITIEDHAVLSGGAAIHHFVTIGRYAFIGGNAGVVHDCPPYMISDGHPARVRGVNIIGLQRHRFAPEVIERLKHVYRLLYKGEWGTHAQALQRVRARYVDDGIVMELCRFAARKADSIHGRYYESLRRDNKRAAPHR